MVTPARSSSRPRAPGSSERPRLFGPSTDGDPQELRDAIARTRRIVGVGLALWVVGGASDLVVAASEGAPLAWLWSIRVGYGLVVLGVWLRLRAAPPPSEPLFDALSRLTYFGAAFALGWYAVLWRGLDSPAGHGVSAVLCVQALGRPLPLRRGLASMGLTALGYPLALLVGALFDEGVRAQLGELRPLSMLGFQVVLTVATAGILAAGGASTWSLKKRLHEARLVGRYRLERKLGEGGMGEVWRAFHPALKKHVAVKILRAELASGPGLSRFDREIEAMTELVHPNTVRVFDAGMTDDGLHYYAMELLEGETLAELVQADGPLHPARAVHLVRQAARAIAEAHERGLVHRDVKPENIFVCDMGGERDFVKVLDFGIAKALGPAFDTALTREGVVVGTPAYMSPEQAMGREVDARSDVYALGCVLFYALTGSPPFEGPAARVLTAHAHEEAPRVGACMPWVAPAELDALVARALAKSADERVGSMLELDRALAAIPGLDGVEQRMHSSPTPRALAETDLEVPQGKSAS